MEYHRHDRRRHRAATPAGREPAVRRRPAQPRYPAQPCQTHRTHRRPGTVRRHSRLFGLPRPRRDRFDQGLGDLFVIRVAGNIVAPSQVGSVEFAVARFDTRLVVVLGHSQCGAVRATVEQLQRPTGDQSRNIRSIVDRIRPSVEGLLATELRHHPDALMQQAVRANVRASVNHLRHGSELIENLIDHDSLLIVGAEYSLATGVVDFLNGNQETVS